MLMSFLRVLDRQGMLKGDLSWTQRDSLTYLMRKEMDEEVMIEKIRMENFALASNPATSTNYLKNLLEVEEEDEMAEELREEGYEVDWHTPKDAAEVADVLANLGLKQPTS